MEYTTLANGVKMPLLGFGGGWFPKSICDIEQNFIEGIKCGYRLVDTSMSYASSPDDIGSAIKKSGVPRDDFFICLKIGNAEQRTRNIRENLTETLKRLGTDYVDAFLMHWPLPDYYLENWAQMEEVYKEGLVRSIGMSNCHEHHLDALLEVAKIPPMINQVEVHPIFQNKSVRRYCAEKNIHVMSYTPLGRMNGLITTNAWLMDMCKKYNKSMAQIILRWHIQSNLTAIPCPFTLEQTRENFDVFDFSLTDDEVTLIGFINCDLRMRYNPDTVDYRNV